ncbi:MAG: type III-B CRISPR module RAMP protein Cmr6 [Gammaproteobacteria bacterium]|nr:type III-B CRISPR module RAMP protein Cmr6 [Gammaproteobacteria bacterium]
MMISPLYQNIGQPHKQGDSHAGLWYDRFFNRYSGEWKVEDDSKKKWINEVTAQTVGDRERLKRYSEQTLKRVTVLHGRCDSFKSDWRWATGLGNAHPVENGMSWHPTLGVPFLAGSSVKGLVRAWVEVGDETLDDKERSRRLKAWFGTVDKEDVAEHAGGFIFFDALPMIPVTLVCDVMTPHMGKWYEKGGSDPLNDEVTPADWHEPIPVPFLVAQKSELQFAIAPRTVELKAEISTLFEALEQALLWLGAGAKTAAGYGYMQWQSQMLPPEIPDPNKTEEEQLLDRLFESFTQASNKKTLKPGGTEVQLRQKILEDAQHWSPALKQQAAEVIRKTLVMQKWSNKSKEKNQQLMATLE